MAIHENSVEAFHELEDFLVGRRAEVYAWLKENGKATDRQVKIGLGYDDMNQVRPRVSELVAADLLKEVDRVKDKSTGRRVRVVQVNDD